MRQPYGPGDIIEIDVIDAEPGVFGPSSEFKTARARRPRPRWLVPTAIGAVAVVGAVAMVWRPWEHPPEWRTFGPAAPPVSSLSDHLVIDLDGLEITSLHEGQNLDADEPTPLGHVFAVPGGSYEYDGWALFHSRASNAAREATASTSTDLVRGLPAEIRHVRVRTTVTWGPVEGNYWDAETNRLDDDKALEFANAVGVEEGLPAVAYSHNLGTLQPVGDVKTLARVQVLADHLAGEPVLSKFTPTIVTYDVDGSPVTVASIGTDTDGLAMARFYLGKGRNVIVHGVPAAVIETRRIGKVVVWYEGNRLVVVAAEGTDAELFDLADATRPASAEEWDAALSATAPALPDPGFDVTLPLVARPAEPISSGITLYGIPYRVTITLGNPTVICAHLGPEDSSQGACVYTTPLSPGLHAIQKATIGEEFVVAVVPHDSNQVLSVTLAGGNVTMVPSMTMLSDSSFAMAALVPEGSTYELVESAGVTQIGFGTGPAGAAASLTASLVAADQLQVCPEPRTTNESSCSTETLVAGQNQLRLTTIDGVTVALATVGPDAADPTVRVTHRDGNAEVYPLYPPTPSLPSQAAAVFLTDDVESVALFVGGEVVARLQDPVPDCGSAWRCRD